MNQRVPFVDLARMHTPIKSRLIEKATSVIERSAFVLGPEVDEFETAFAKYIGTKFAVGVSNGLDALTLALRALGIGPGDEVITAANTFIATAYAISATGATPVFADVEETTANLSSESVKKRITSKTKAIIPVHLFGQSASFAELEKIASEGSRRIPLIEDAAQAHGSTYGQRKCGAMGTLGCFSFYPGKNLGALGEGGAVVTSDPALHEKLKTLRNVGQKTKNVHTEIAGNYRIHNLQAGFLTIKLEHLDEYNRSRIAAAQSYQKALSGIPGLILPQVAEGRNHVYHLYVVATRDLSQRDRLQTHLNQAGVGTAIHYPTPVHLQPCYRGLGYQAGDFPVAERLASSILSLPMFPGITADEIGIVAGSVREFFHC